MIEFTVIAQVFFTGAVGVVGFFLRQIYSSIREMSESVNRLNERLARHEESNNSFSARILRLESKYDSLEQQYRDLFRDYELTRK